METIVSKQNGKPTNAWLGGPKMNRENARPTTVETPKKPTTDKLTFAVEDVDAKRALSYLETQVGDTNRHVSDPRVKAFSEVMKRGQWRLNSQPIAFDSEGHLVDGQHRLWAIVTAQTVIVRLAVAYGLDDDAVKTIDRGRVRSIGESLRRDSSIPKSLRKECGRISAWSRAETLMLTNSTVPGSVEDTENYYERNRLAVEFALDLIPKKGALKLASIGAAIVFAMRRYPDEVRQFAEQLVEGSWPDKNSPACVLFKHVDRTTGNVPMTRRPMAIKTLRAIQAFIEGEVIGDAKLYANEAAIAFFMAETAAPRKGRRR